MEYIIENCIADRPVISETSVHQDEMDASDMMDGNRRIDGLNTEANAITEQTVYYDIRLKAVIPGNPEPLQFIINLEVQVDDNPGYPLVKRGFYYCARMISEQYGTVFTKAEYDKLQKVYSIWICPDPAKKRKNGIFRYHTIEDVVYGKTYALPEQYDLMEVVILNLGDANRLSDFQILDLLNTLLSVEISPEEKKKRLENDFHIAMTEAFESEVENMCNLSGALVQMSEQRGKKLGKVEGKDLILSLMQKLFAAGRIEDAQRASNDKDFCEQLLVEYGLMKS